MKGRCKMSVGQGRESVMRIVCPHCSKKAAITHINRMSPSVTDAYCRCNNHECQAGFVVTVAHKHDTQPPINSLQSMLVQTLRTLPKEQLNAVLELAKA